MQVPNPKEHGPLNAAWSGMWEYLQVVLGVDDLPIVEDVVAETREYLQDVVIGVDILVAFLVWFDAGLLVLTLVVLQVEFQQDLGVLHRDILEQKRGEEVSNGLSQSVLEMLFVLDWISECRLEGQTDTVFSILNQVL